MYNNLFLLYIFNYLVDNYNSIYQNSGSIAFAQHWQHFE
jgi:hypothetical protein